MKNESRTSTPFTGTDPTKTPAEVQDQIRRRAQELYEARGRQDGHDLDDWLQAEIEVLEATKPEAEAA